MRILISAMLLSIVSQLGMSTEPGKTESLLGKTVLVLLAEPLDNYRLEITQPKSRHMLAESDVRYALQHSSLLDPTLPRVRQNAWPLGAHVRLVSKTQPTARVIEIELAGLGLLKDYPVTYVFEYNLPPFRGQSYK